MKVLIRKTITDMKILYVFLILISLVITSCRKSSKWEEIDGKGIKMGVPYAVYFKNLEEGFLGSNLLVNNELDSNRIEVIPSLFHTVNGGKNWSSLKFDKEIKGTVVNLCLSNDTLYCEVRDSIRTMYKSLNRGQSWTELDTVEMFSVRKRLFYQERYKIDKNPNFKFNKSDYWIKEKFVFKNTIIIVCYNEEPLRDYYFVSHNNGNDWMLLQKEVGSNKRKYLLNGEYLITYESPYGLQILNINK